MPMTLLIPLAAITLLAIALLVWALRGRRVDDHPLCRRCRYDLCGAAATPEICPECGRALTKPRSVRYGHRRKRWVALVIAVFMLVGSVGGGGLVGWRNSQDYDWNRAKPMWWLKLDTTGDDSVRVRGALWEMLRRVSEESLSSSQVEDLVELALDVQGDTATPWEDWWGEIIEQAWMQQFVDEEQLALYLRQMIEPAVTLQTRKRMRENGVLRYLVAYDELRGARQSAFRVWRLTESLEWGDYRSAGGGEFASSGRESGFGVGSAIAPGTHELRMESRFLLMTDEERKRWNNRDKSVRARIEATIETLAELNTVMTSTIVVVPADKPTLEFVDDPDLREAVRASLLVDSVRVEAGERVSVHARITGQAPPIDLAFMISARIGAIEIPLEPYAFPAPGGDRTPVSRWWRAGEGPEIPADLTHIDFVFRPNAEIAEEQFAGFDRIYGGPEIVIKNVPVEIVRENEGE